MLMSARNDEAICLVVDFKTAQGGIERADDEAIGGGEAFGVAVLGPIIKNPNIEIDFGCEFGDFLTDVPGPHDQESTAL